MTAPTITVDDVAEHRRRIQSQISDAREVCTLAVAEASTPAAGRTLVAHACQLSNLLLDDWQLGIVEDLVEHHTKHDSACTSELCVMDDDELVEMADRWALPWPTLATWLRALAEEPPR